MLTRSRLPLISSQESKHAQTSEWRIGPFYISLHITGFADAMVADRKLRLMVVIMKSYADQLHENGVRGYLAMIHIAAYRRIYTGSSPVETS